MKNQNKHAIYRKSKDQRVPKTTTTHDQSSVPNNMQPPSQLDVEELTKKVTKTQLFKFIIIATSIIAFLATIISNVGTIQDFINTHFFPNNKLIADVQGLLPGANIQSYESTFGSPTFIDSWKAQEKEYTFVNTHFFLYALTDKDDNVIYFAVTIRDLNFNPTFTSAAFRNGSPTFQVTLGKTTFSEISDPPNDVSYSVGANSYGYYETRGYGHPSNFEEYGFGLNMYGSIPDNFQDKDYLGPLIKYQGPPDQENADIAKLNYFRSNVYINTFAISAPFISLRDYVRWISLGVNDIQVLGSN